MTCWLAGSGGLLDCLCDSLGDLALELADELGWCLAWVADLAEDMLRVHSSAFACLAEVDVAADSAFVADSCDGRDLASVAGHTSMLSFLLSTVCSPNSWIQDL